MPSSHIMRTVVLLCIFVACVVVQSCTTVPKTVTAPKSATTAAPQEFTVFYESDPPGAILYEKKDGNKLGEMPFWVMYELTEKDRQRGMIFIEPSWAVWQSGVARSNHPGIIFDLKAGLAQTYVYVRPEGKGKDEDYDYGLKRLMKRYTYGEDEGTIK